LTCGQWVAHERLAGRDTNEPRLAEVVAEAREEGRPVDPDLLDPSRRKARLEEALAAEVRAPALAFLAREYASAREV
jgi:hypothetical protein